MKTVKCVGTIALVAALLASCDKLNAHRIAVSITSGGSRAAPSQDDVLECLREALASCDLKQVEESAQSETWEWRDPEEPPGLFATIRWDEEAVEVILAQDFYGPIGPTDKYRSVLAKLRETAEERFGSESIRVQKGP